MFLMMNFVNALNFDDMEKRVNEQMDEIADRINKQSEQWTNPFEKEESKDE